VKVRSSILRIAQWLSLRIGLALLAYAGGTALYAGIYQRYQSRLFDQQIAAPPIIKPAAFAKPVDLQEGDLIGKLEIPRIRIAVMVLQGMEEKTLLLGAGHVPGTPLPGAQGNVVLAAHRDTYFRKVAGIRSGDRIRFVTVRESHEYVVSSTEIVDPEDTRAMESQGREELTLITCFPFYFVGSAPKRFIVHARPVIGSESD
jgi:sortase A